MNIINNIIIENTVCLNTSNFILSLLLSFTIDLYNLKPLTAIPNIAGINKILGKKKSTIVNINPFDIPNIFTHIDTV